MIYYFCETNFIFSMVRIFIFINKGIVFLLFKQNEFGKNANSIYVCTVIGAIRKVCFATVGVCAFHALAFADAFFILWRLL